jgi:hypothetical protein
MTREVRIGIAAVVLLGLIVFGLLIVGNVGEVRPELERTPVAAALAGDQPPAERYGRAELRLVGWYAELDADCAGDDGGADTSVAWLQRDCPLRVLLPSQPHEAASQAELEAEGIRLSAPRNNVFPSRAEPAGPNLQLEPLVFVGRFDDPAAGACLAERIVRCRNTFVVTDYDGLVR